MKKQIRLFQDVLCLLLLFFKMRIFRLKCRKKSHIFIVFLSVFECKEVCRRDAFSPLTVWFQVRCDGPDPASDWP